MNTAELIHKIHKRYFTSIVLTHLELENQNKEYFGARFRLNNHSIRFRKGKITPTKAGLFVVAWEKDSNNKNKAYSYDDTTEYFIIECENEFRCGFFIFHKDVLLKHKILSSDKQVGKMGFRVYPPWDCLKSAQALNTQEWQREYFIDSDQEEITKIFF